jgi:hypothetical protein
MTPQQEAAFDAKVEKHFRSHRELPNGRNFRCWNREANPEGDKLFRENYEQIDWNTPVVPSPSWA